AGAFIIAFAWLRSGGGAQTCSCSDTTGLVWTQRAKAPLIGTDNLVMFYAQASAAVVNSTVTISTTGTSTVTRGCAFSFLGVDTVNPFDPNPSLPSLSP